MLDDFELEVRKLAGVVAVGFSGGEDDLTVHVSVGDTTDALAAEAQLPDMLRLHFDRPVACLVGVVGGAPGAIGELFVVPDEQLPDSSPSRKPSPGSGGDRRHEGERRASPTITEMASEQILRRVEFIAVNLADEGENVEVHLSLEGRRESARRAGGRAKAAAEATIEALHALGWKAPFTVRSAIRLAVGAEGAVIVYLDGSGAERMGISRARTTEEAAVKATLHALNRYLEDPRHQSA
jgi:hypothetical protein